MPVFHTKTIESILEPVAQQVSRLVIIHEEGEAGHAMPDLSRPVQAVSKAVHNLVKVGREMVQTTDDAVMQQDVPPALTKVETAAHLLEEAAMLSQIDPLSKSAREKLIAGSRSILQGTSNVLLVFDESEVRKIIANAKKVMEYLAVAEVIETPDDLITFVKNITPVFTKLNKEVTNRTEDLTHQAHKEMLMRCVDQLNTLCPILICAMRIFIEILSKVGAKGEEEAAENRNYLVLRMTEELHEVIRVLQLTTFDEDEWNSDNVSVMKKTLSSIEAKAPAAQDWLQNPDAVVGGMGEKALHQILEEGRKIAERSLPRDGDHLRKLSDDIENLTSSLSELRSDGRGNGPQALALAKSIGERVNEMLQTINVAIDRVEKSGIQRPSATVTGRLEQAKRWLQQPAVDDMGLGQRAVALLVEDGLRIGEVLPPPNGEHVKSLCNYIEQIGSDLTNQVKQGRGNSSPAQAMAKTLVSKLDELKSDIQNALVNKVVEDFLDIASPLKKFTDAVDACRADSSNPANEDNFIEKANQLGEFSAACVSTANMVAVGSDTGNKRVAEALQAVSLQVESLIPQLIHAGRIKMVYLDNKAADDHFENLRNQYSDAIQRVRALCDAATDSQAFVERSLEAMHEATRGCETAIQTSNAAKLVEQASKLGRLSNRVIHVAKQETENSEDPTFIARLNMAIDNMHSNVPPMVQSAKSLAFNITTPAKAVEWRRNNDKLLESVQGVEEAIGSSQPEEPPLPPYPNISDLSISDEPPPRPPLPAELGAAAVNSYGGTASTGGGGGGRYYGGGHLDTTTDDESEEIFQKAPTPSQGPIMMAAHDLHQEVKQWSSKDNDIIAAAKKMALLMAKLSQLVQEDSGSKKDLIACAKSIAESSEAVTRIAKELAKECTDKRMRTALLQVCERIPTIATQLNILSTVKATMLGAQGSGEDQEATEMLVGNAQNLMQSVKQTVTAAEAATIKIRTDAGIRLIWNRKRPWYNY